MKHRPAESGVEAQHQRGREGPGLRGDIAHFANSNAGFLGGLAALGFAIRRERRLNELKSEFISNVSHELKTPLSIISMFGEMLARDVNFVLHAAGWLEGGLAIGYEKFILDCDQLGMMHKLLAGYDLSENGQAMDAIREVGPGKHFFGCAHTQANYETAFYRSPLADMLGLRLHLFHEPGALDDIGEAGIVFHVCGDRQLTARLDARDQEWLAQGARGIDRGGVAGGA